MESVQLESQYLQSYDGILQNLAWKNQRFNLQKNCLENNVVCLQPVVGPKVLRFSTRSQALQLRTNISENRVGCAVLWLLCLHSDDYRLPGLLPRPQFIKRRTEVFHCRQDSAVVKVGCACCRKFWARGLAGIICKSVIGIRRIQWGRPRCTSAMIWFMMANRWQVRCSLQKKSKIYHFSTWHLLSNVLGTIRAEQLHQQNSRMR